MYYYEIVPADKNYRGARLLTYFFDKKLEAGQLVEIQLRNKDILGFVLNQVSKPSFAVKPLLKVRTNVVLPNVSLKVFESINTYYPNYLGAVGQLVAPSFLKRDAVAEDSKKSDKKRPAKTLPPLNDEQRKAYQKITSQKNGASTFIIHGETGSGKTRLYLELAKTTIYKNKSVMILTPEISLTAPLAKQFKDNFGGMVIVNHSNLTDKQRYLNWQSVRNAKEPQVLIGPRSTVFMPLQNTGLIVIDEFHDQAYKQDAPPYYSTTRTASMLSSITGAKQIMGSATPSISEYFIAEQKNIPILKMLNQAVTNKPAVSNYKVVDLTKKEEKSRYPLISNSLIKCLSEQISSNKQALVFINKRGSARSIVCQSCGWRALCPNCELPLTYHDDQHKLRCHTCGYSDNPPSNCPVCKSFDITFKSPGTKMIVHNLSKIFPEAKIVRFDKDNKKSEKMENNYPSLVSGEANIIVGTQLITKGHDLPNLALVAILQAEAGLDFPDFSSEERSFQLIKQLLGRVNRGHTPGIVLMQTYDTSNSAIKYAASGNWQEFYEAQLKQRKKYKLPPFCHALKIEVSRKSRQSAQKNLNSLVQKIKNENSKIEILGPTPNFIEKKSGNYSWQIIVKANNRSDLMKVALGLGGAYKANLDPFNFL